MNSTIMRRVLGFLFVACAAGAADRTWNGGSSTDSNWSRPENWSGAAVAPGDALFFGGAVRTGNSNDLTPGTAFAGLTFLPGAAAFTLGGNEITLTGSISNFSANAQTFNLPMALTGIHAIYGSNTDFTVNGVLSGTGGLYLDTTNKTITLSGNNTYEGLTTVTNGRLTVTHHRALGSPASGTVVFGRCNGSLRLTGGVQIDEPITMKGQILPWINSLSGGSGSNIINGTVYKEIDVSLGADSGGTLVFRGGVKHVSGGTMYIRNSATVVFENKPIEFGGSAAVQPETSGTTVLAVPGNTFSFLKIANHARVRTDVANALPPGCALEIGGSWDADGLLDLNGCDQTVGTIRTDPRWSAPGYLAVTSALPATLTVNQGGNSTYAGAFDGAVSLVKNNGGTILITNVVSKTSGEVTLNGGAIVVAETASFSACPIFRVNGGTLELRNGNALPAAAVVRALEGAKLKIKTGVTNVIDRLYLDGEQQVSGTWGASGSGADNVNDLFFSGGGVLNVVSGTLTPYADATWDGGGSDLNMSTGANWSDDAAPNFEGFARAIFAGGVTAVVDTAASFSKMTFNANTNFTVAAGTGILTNGAGGIRAIPPTSTPRTYTLAEDVVLADHQFWIITNPATLNVTGAVSDGGNACKLTKRGSGVLILAGDNSYGGVTMIETNYAIIRHGHALGATNANTVIQDGAYLVLEGGISLPEPISMTGDMWLGYQGTLRSNSGTNTLSARVTSNGARIRTNNNGCWEVTGGVDGAGLTCTAVSGTYIRFTEKPITTSGFTCHTYGGSVILAVAGNTFSSMEAGGTEFRTDVPFAWPANVTLNQGSSGSPSSVLNFNGNDQAVGTLKTSYNDSSLRLIYSAAPMSLTVNQTSDTTYNAMITGAVSIVKLGTGNLSLTNRFTTTSGSFIVSNGTLTVSHLGTLGPNSTNIVVGGSGTLLLSNSVAVADTATVRLPAAGVSTAKINLASGVNETVSRLYYGKDMKRAGTYGSSASPAVFKDDTHFAGAGVLRVLHDDFGTMIQVH